MTEERLRIIETKIAYQDLTIEELNSVVIDQQKTIDKLEKTLKSVTKKMSEIADMSGSETGGSQKPPHY